jgi:hypothetical protein
MRASFPLIGSPLRSIISCRVLNSLHGNQHVRQSLGVPTVRLNHTDNAKVSYFNIHSLCGFTTTHWLLGMVVSGTPLKGACIADDQREFECKYGQFCG